MDICELLVREMSTSREKATEVNDDSVDDRGSETSYNAAAAVGVRDGSAWQAGAGAGVSIRHLYSTATVRVCVRD